MDYEKKYKDLVKAVKELQEVNPSDEGIQKWVENNVPELAEPEDERVRKALIDFFSRGAENGAQTNGVCDKDIIAWLEKQGEQNPAWSEEDENHIQHISDFIMRNRVGDTDAIYRLEQDVNWLKSLKDRYTWKPSDEQMEALEKECFAHSNYDLCRLLEDLKKLKG